jgi:hypothetical protein
VCDLAFYIRAEQIRRTALAQMQLAPHLEEGAELVSPDQAVDEFAAWLLAEPENVVVDDEESELFELLGVKR